MTVFLISLAIFGIAMLSMGVGVLFSNRCLRGSCGGPEVLGPDGEPLSCEACPRRKDGAAGELPTQTRHA